MYDTPALCSSQEAFEFTPTGSKSVLWLGVGSFDGLQEMHGWAVDENSEKTRLPSGPLQEGCEPREITYKVVFLNMSLLLLLLWWNNSGAKKKKRLKSWFHSEVLHESVARFCGSFCVRDASFLSESWTENVQNTNVCVRFCLDLRSGDLCKLEKYLIWLLQSDVQA